MVRLQPPEPVIGEAARRQKEAATLHPAPVDAWLVAIGTSSPSVHRLSAAFDRRAAGEAPPKGGPSVSDS